MKIEELYKKYSEQPIEEDTVTCLIPIGEEKIEIKVKKKISYEDKVKLIDELIDNVLDGSFINAVKEDFYWMVLVVKYYTDIEFSDEQIAELQYHLIDFFNESGLFQQVCNVIDRNDIDTLQDLAFSAIDYIDKYSNSARGIMESIASDYSNVAAEVDEVAKTINDPDSLKFVKDFLAKVN